jgi:DnaK suppressor protein
MGPADLQRYERRLLDKRGELSPAQTEASTRVPPAGGLPGDLLDQATADSEAELQIRLHQTDGRLLTAIEGALARIRHRTYGVCEACERLISKARLEAVPWTHLCRKCKERQSA